MLENRRARQSHPPSVGVRLGMVVTLLTFILALFPALAASRALPSAAPGLLTFVEARFDTGLSGALAVAISPDGDHAYVAGYTDDAVVVFDRNKSTGALSYLEMAQDGVGDVDGLNGANSVAVSPDGDHVYATGTYDDAVAIFDRDETTGALTFAGVHKDTDPGIDGLDGASQVVISPDGRHVYVPSYSDHAVALFDRDQTSGALTFVEAIKDSDPGVDGLNGARAVAISPGGNHAYVAGRLENAVTLFDRNASSGALTFVAMYQDDVGDVDGLDGARAVAVSPDGAHVYVTSWDENAVVVFSRDEASGALTFVELQQDGVGDVDGLSNARAVTLSPDGRYVFVAGAGDDALAVFGRDRATGKLTFVELHQDGVGDVDGLDGASAVTICPDGNHVYVAGNADNGVALFRRQFTLYLPLVARNYSPPYLVKDIHPTDDSKPDELTVVNGTLFFSADDGVHGVELWKSDGTAAGTTLVKDINPDGDSTPEELINVNGTLFFRADDGVHGVELWKSDGTTAGTTMLKDINPTGGAYPYWFTNVNGTLFFSAEDPTHGEELWKSDGTPAGTVMVKDIHPTDGSYPGSLTEMNGLLYFNADDVTYSTELWKSDGTAAGTVMVKDINPTGFSNPTRLANVNGTLFFVAHDGVNGIELWKSDGTEAGTTLVQVINAEEFFYTNEIVNVNGTAFFTADDGVNGEELWKSDGTPAGTVMVKDIHPTGTANPIRLTAVNGTLFFTADDGTSGEELWKSDGTTAGTTIVKDIRPSGGSDPNELANVNGVLYFGATDGSIGRELWRSDGTEAGTVLVKDLNPVAWRGSFPAEITYMDGTLFFRADDGITGLELWALRLRP